MGTLLLIRHGQASFLAEDYDQLSPLGIAQSARLGAYWAESGVTFDQVYSGPRRRQIDTADAVVRAYAQAGKRFPEPQILPEFDEYPGEAIYQLGLRRLLGEDRAFQAMHLAFEQATGFESRSRTFQKAYAYLADQWVRGTLRAPELETWPSFCRRVEAGVLQATSDRAGSRRIAVFTSGGPIAVAMQRALHLAPEVTLRTSFMSRNASWSEFLYSGSERFTLSSFNAYPHLQREPAMLTYR